MPPQTPYGSRTRQRVRGALGDHRARRADGLGRRLAGGSRRAALAVGVEEQGAVRAPAGSRPAASPRGRRWDRGAVRRQPWCPPALRGCVRRTVIPLHKLVKLTAMNNVTTRRDAGADVRSAEWRSGRRAGQSLRVRRARGRATPPAPPARGPALTVAAVARRLGVAPATLRTWDRRYGLGPTEHAPARTAATRRATSPGSRSCAGSSSRGCRRRGGPRRAARPPASRRSRVARPRPPQARPTSTAARRDRRSRVGGASSRCPAAAATPWPGPRRDGPRRHARVRDRRRQLSSAGASSRPGTTCWCPSSWPSVRAGRPPVRASRSSTSSPSASPRRSRRHGAARRAQPAPRAARQRGRGAAHAAAARVAAALAERRIAARPRCAGAARRAGRAVRRSGPSPSWCGPGPRARRGARRSPSCPRCARHRSCSSAGRGWREDLPAGVTRVDDLVDAVSRISHAVAV